MGSRKSAVWINFHNLAMVSNHLAVRGQLMANRSEKVDGETAPALNIIDSIEKIVADKDAEIERLRAQLQDSPKACRHCDDIGSSE